MTTDDDDCILRKGPREYIQESSNNHNHNDNQSTTTASDTMVPMGVLPAYLSEAFADLYGEDGLVVLGKGLGALPLLATFVRFYGDVEDGHMAILRDNQEEEEEEQQRQRRRSEQRNRNRNTNERSPPGSPNTHSVLPLKTICDKPPLVFVLGLKEGERNALINILESWGTPLELLPKIITNESGQGKDRALLYNNGGVFVITSRILIVDMLNHTVSSNHIDGFFVAHAEAVTDQSTEAFILRIYHSQKQPFGSGFTKAFCSDPDQLLSGFAKVDKILKALFVRKLYLYPRFHHHVRDELDHHRSHPPSGATGTTTSSSTTTPPVIVTEFHQKLSPLQSDMQAALVVAVQTCLRELKSALPTLLNWADPELSVENCVTSSFDRTISRQLEPEWHKLHPATKQLVQDLRTLRTLFQYLIVYDCISFWNLLTNLKTTSVQTKHPSLWLLTPAADLLFRSAKARCYSIVKPTQAPTAAQHVTRRRPVARLIPKLEVNPKWKLLQHVLLEIQTDYRNHNTTQKQTNPTSSQRLSGGCPTTVWIMVREDRTVESLQSYLTENGTNRTLLLRWLRYLEGINDRSRSKFMSTSAAMYYTASSTLTATKDSANTNTAHTHPSATATATAATMAEQPLTIESDISNMPEEDRLLLEEEGRVRRILFGTGASFKKSTNTRPIVAAAAPHRHHHHHHKPKTATETTTTATTMTKNHMMKKRRRVAEEMSRGDVIHQADDLEREAVLDDAVAATEREWVDAASDNLRAAAASASVTTSAAARPLDENCCFDSDKEEEEEMDEEEMFRVSFDSELRIVIKSYASMETDEALLLLQDSQPQYVILYDTEMAFIRSVEIYAALRLEPSSSARGAVRVYFLMFEASAEEKNFMKSLEREKNAFERLIHHKKTMPPPVIQIHASQEMQQAMKQGTNGGIAGTYMGGVLPLAIDTRRGRGKVDALTTTQERRDIAVDVREFRSVLPSILHQGGMRIAPVTLTVGDFVLSNIHCVERKSVSDLFGSLASGRLYTQAEAMCKYYKCPCLLIEFDPQKSFSLQNVSELGAEIRTDSICSKMALLIMHFPRLRILWSRSPHETLKLFRDLKVNHEEVNVTRAVEMGQSDDGIIESSLSSSVSSAVSLLDPPPPSSSAATTTTTTVTENHHDSHHSSRNNEEEKTTTTTVLFFNEAARDMLLRLPGVTVPIARRMMHQVPSLAQLVELPRDELRRIAGPVVGQKLFTFFRQTLD